MRAAGIEVLDCSSTMRGPLRYADGFRKFLFAAGKSDVVLIGFLGHFIMPFAKLVTRKKIIFDAFVSVYQTMASDRGVFKPGSLAARLAGYIDKKACLLADAVLLDTDSHIDYYCRRYGLGRDKFAKVPASADDKVMKPMAGREDGSFIVHFHGEFQPLHGAKYIISAAAMLPDVKFRITGKGKTLAKCLDLAKARNLGNVEFLEPVSYEKLARRMAQADICLGIFGRTEKADMVIPNKVYEAMAMEKPVITARTAAAEELFRHGENVFFTEPADPAGLAAAIAELKEDPALRQRIAEGGYRLFREKCSPAIVGNMIRETAEKLKKRD